MLYKPRTSSMVGDTQLIVANTLLIIAWQTTDVAWTQQCPQCHLQHFTAFCIALLQLVNFHFPLLLWVPRVWMAQLLLLEWPGTQQHHLPSVRVDFRTSRFSPACSCDLQQYQYIRHCSHSDWSLVWYILFHHYGSYWKTKRSNHSPAV